MKHSFKRELWISFGIVFGAIAAASVGLYFLSKDLTAETNEIILNKTLTTRQAAALGILAHLKKDVPRAAEYRAAIAKLLPTHDELIGFPKHLNALAKSHAVSANFSFRGDNTAATDLVPGNDGFSLNATGAAENLVAFLKDIETQSPGFLLGIDSFDFGSSGAGYQFSAQGKLFSR